MKYVLISVITILGLGFLLLQEPEKMIVDVQPGAAIDVVQLNPMRGAPDLVSMEAAKPLDFTELDEPFAPDAIDTEIAGELKVDDNGDLIIDEELKSYMDYFLSSVGQVTPEQAIRRLHLLFNKNLPEHAAKQAMETLQGYLAFKEASFDLMAEPIDSERASTDAEYRFNRLEYALTTLKNLRREYMDGHAADGFFQEDEAFADYTLEKQRIALDDSLTLIERKELLAQARSSMPEEMADIAAQQEDRAFRQQGLQQLISDGADLDSISRYAYENFSPEEARGIVTHYEREAITKSQYQLYRQQVESLMEQGLSKTDFDLAKQELAIQYFTEDQVSKVEAWDLALAQESQ